MDTSVSRDLFPLRRRGGAGHAVELSCSLDPAIFQISLTFHQTRRFKSYLHVPTASPSRFTIVLMVMDRLMARMSGEPFQPVRHNDKPVTVMVSECLNRPLFQRIDIGRGKGVLQRFGEAKARMSVSHSFTF